MQRQVWKENIKVDRKKKEEEEEKKNAKKGYDPLMYPFGAEEVLLRAELAKLEKNEER